MAPSGKRGSHEEGPITEAQMVTILREADQQPIAEVAKKHRVSVSPSRRRASRCNPRPGVALVRKPVDIAFLESALTRVLRDLEQPR